MRLKAHILGLLEGFRWWFTNSLLSHIPSKRLRFWGLKVAGMKFGGDVRFYGGFHIRSPKGICIGKGVSIGPKVLLDGRRGLTIGDNTVIAYEAIIWTLNHDYNDLHFSGKGAPVSIGKYCWICSRSMILPGVKIGDGAVVASGAIVTKDVPEYSIVAGVPAKVIGNREKKDWEYGYSFKNDCTHLV